MNNSPPKGDERPWSKEGLPVKKEWRRKRLPAIADHSKPAESAPARTKPISEILLEEGYITPDQFSQILQENNGDDAKLCDVLVRRGWITEQAYAKAMKDVGRRLKLGEILLNEGLITPAQLERALACKEGSKKTLGEILIELEFIEERTILMCVSRQLNIQYLDVSRDDFSILDPELRETLGSVPKSLWTELNCLPIFHIDSTSITSAKKSAPSSSDAGKREYRGGHLSVVMSDPLNKAALEKIEKATFAEVSAYVCNAASIRKGIEYMFAPNRAPKQTPGGMNVADMGKYVRYLNKLLFLGVLRWASDVHVEPCEMDVNVRMRINGKLRKIDHFPSEDLRGFVNVVKHSGRLDITQQHIAHDGSFMRALGGHIVDIRVSVIPTIYGEKVVLRFLLQDMSQKSLHDSNLPPRIERQLVNVMRKKSGVILVTGPTGSGKTTMLHRAIRHIAGEDINIQTIEEPVEYRAGEFVNQTAVNEARGFTYPMAIKSVLRQDPDVILVGEIRDKETAQIATEAALTGHLVLSTLHTEDALGSIVRLIQLGVAEWLISSTVVTVINQRLIRKFCDCAEDMPMFPGREYFRGMDIDDHVLDALERDWPKYKIKSPVGCKKCDGEGYRSLQVIVEQLTLTSMVRDMIREGKPYREVIDFIRSKHYMNMIFEEGLRQIMLGNTGFEELRDLPRGDYVMKYPEEIIRDATETAETRRVDIETTSLPQAFVVPREVYDPAPEKSEIGMASIKSPPREALRWPVSDDAIDRILADSEVRRRLVLRLLEMDTKPAPPKDVPAASDKTS